MKKILFICDPIQNFKILTDTTYSLMLAANETKYSIYYVLPNNIYFENNAIIAKCKSLTILCKSEDLPIINNPWYLEDDVFQILNLNEFHSIFVRNDPPFNMEYYYLTQILSIAEQQNIKIVNNSYALRNFNEKMSILNFPALITPTMVTKDPESIHSFLFEHGDCVIKPLDMMAGRGVFKISINDVNSSAIIEAATNYYTQTIMLQKFIPEVIYGDKRIFIVNGQIIEYCLHRIPQGTQIRGNIAAGGRGEVHKVSPEDFNLATQVASWLKQNKILFAGLDVIGNKLTEINITSPTGTRQILTHTGINIPKLIIQSL